MVNQRLMGLGALLWACTIPATHAKDNFTSVGTVTTGGLTEQASRGFVDIESAIDFFANASLTKTFPTYQDPLSTIDGQLDYRGLPMQVGYLTSGSSEFTFIIPNLNINKSFTGSTRDDSKDQFDEFLKESGNDILNRIHKELARVSPTDPVAGNPSSLMGRAVSSGFNSGFFTVAGSGYYESEVRLNTAQLEAYRSAAERQGMPGSESSSTVPGSSAAPGARTGDGTSTAVEGSDGQSSSRQTEAHSSTAHGSSEALLLQREQSASGTVFEGAPDEQARGNQVGIGIDVERYDLGDNDVDVIRLPISYMLRSEDDPRKALLINVPITWAQANDADTYTVNMDVSLSWPMNRYWTLTPTIGYGVTGSEDLGSVGQLASFGLTSHLQFLLDDRSQVHVGNMIGQYNTLPSSIGDYDIDPKIKNTAFRNGVMYRLPGGVIMEAFTAEFFLIDTRFTGDDLFADEYQEIGFALGSAPKDYDVDESILRLGITYLHSSSDVKAVKANFGFKF